jgi:hypothetical protein
MSCLAVITRIVFTWTRSLHSPGPTYAAFMVKAMTQHVTAMDAASPPAIDGVPYAMLSNDNSFTGGWEQRTLLTTFTKPSQPQQQQQQQQQQGGQQQGQGGRDGHDGYTARAYTARAGTQPRASAPYSNYASYAVVKKPDLSVMPLLSRLGTRRLGLRVQGGGSEAKLGVVASASDRMIRGGLGGGGASASGGASGGCVSVVIHRSDDTAPTNTSSIPVAIRVTLPSASAASASSMLVAHWRLDADHGNPYAVWLKQGRPHLIFLIFLTLLHSLHLPLQTREPRLAVGCAAHSDGAGPGGGPA